MKAMSIILLAVLLSMVSAGAEDSSSSCVRQLVPCLNYLNGTRDPPDSCCSPLKSLINNHPECLCKLITIKGARQARRAGINTDQAQQLPGRCGQHVNPIACLTAGSRNSRNSVNRSGASTLSSSLVVQGFLALIAIFQLLGTATNDLLHVSSF